MNTQFTMLLLGPAGSGKSSFISSFSEIDIFPYVTAKTLGGANTTKVLTTYEFRQDCADFSVVECTTANPANQAPTLSNLQNLAKEPNGIEKVFDKINDGAFSKKCHSLTLRLPIKAGLLPKGGKIDTVIIRDSQGFGDIRWATDFDINTSGITDDVNTILFFSISSIQQPAIFKEIIDQAMKTNLKTPMFLLRRDHDLTQNDEDFKDKILANLSANDSDLKNIVSEMGQTPASYRLNDLVFELPEVKVWKGALGVEPATHELQEQNYQEASKEILSYAVSMHNQLYQLLVQKMNGQYQKYFVECVLNQLLSDPAFKVVATIVTNPHVKPSNDIISRDTKALSAPPKLIDPNHLASKPFANELHKRGNQYADGVIPSYSYACVNFRNVFPKIINGLPFNDDPMLMDLNPLFHTFMTIVLEPYTVTTATGYTFSNCRQDAFKFYLITRARDHATEFLAQHKLASRQVWKNFTYTPCAIQFQETYAIAVMIYIKLLALLQLPAQFNTYVLSELNHTATAFIEKNRHADLQKQLSRV